MKKLSKKTLNNEEISSSILRLEQSLKEVPLTVNQHNEIFYRLRLIEALMHRLNK